MMLMNTLATDTRNTELPDVADPSRIAPKDARALSRLFSSSCQCWRRATPSTATAATR